MRNGQQLTPKEVEFIQEYFKRSSAVEAYKAVYSCANLSPSQVRDGARRAMERPLVAQEIARIRSNALEECEVTLAEIIKKARKLHDLALDTEQLSVAGKAIELLGKTIGAFTDRVETTKREPVEIRLGINHGATVPSENDASACN